MEAQWFIKIDGQKEGPYSELDLKRHLELTPDTLVWKPGWKEWKPIRDVPELKHLFHDEEESRDDESMDEAGGGQVRPDTVDVAVATGPQLPPFLMAIILLGILLYLLLLILR